MTHVMRLLAPAKINLHLRVGPRRSDGFHPLLTWMTTVGLFDSLELERARVPGIALRIDSTPASAAVPNDRRNLIVRAAEEFGVALSATATREGQVTTAPKVTGLSVLLHKRIPVGAGLGGGSSDAARTLLALNGLWDAHWSLPDLATLSARLGSDLAFFFFGPSSICAGRGEIVRPIAPPRPRAALLFLPEFAISTADAYRRFDAAGEGAAAFTPAGDVHPLAGPEPDWHRWTQLPARELLEELVNDLEPAAFAIQPRLQMLRRQLQSRLGRVVRMSGSGSTLFTLYDEEAEAEEVMAQIRRRQRQLGADRDFTVACAPLAPPEMGDDLSKS